jgi:hypothetical protein
MRSQQANLLQDEAWNPRFVEALQNMSRLEYLMDVLLSGTSGSGQTLSQDTERK